MNNEDKRCWNCLPDDEILEVYDFLIGDYEIRKHNEDKLNELRQDLMEVARLRKERQGDTD